MTTNRWEGVPLVTSGGTPDSQQFEITNAAITQAAQTMIYVGDTLMGSAGTNGNGSPVQPFSTLEAAVNSIAANGDSSKNYTVFVNGEISGATVFDTSLNGKAQSIRIQGKTNTTDKLNGGSAAAALTIQTSVPVTFENLTVTGENIGINISGSGSAVTLGTGVNVTSTANAHGVSVAGGTFTMRSSAKVSGNYDVYLAAGKTINIEGSSLSGDGLVANLVLQQYVRGDAILSASSDDVLDAVKNRFVLIEDTSWEKETVSNQVKLKSDIYVAGSSGRIVCSAPPASPANSSGTKNKPFAAIADAFAVLSSGSDAEIIIDGSISEQLTIGNSLDVNSLKLTGYTDAEHPVSAAELNGDTGTDGTTLTIEAASADFPVTITNLKITGGKASGTDDAGNGGGIKLIKGTVKLSDGVIITGNSAAKGGGVYVGGNGSLFMYGKALIGDVDNDPGMAGATTRTNTATANDGGGGGIYIDGGAVYIGYDSPTHQNEIPVVTDGANTHYYGVRRNYNYGANGAGIYLASGTLKIASGDFYGNKTLYGYGGAIYFAGNANANDSITGGSFRNNYAKNGGAFYIPSGKDVKVNGNALFKENMAQLTGGAVHNTGTFTMTAGTMEDNIVTDNYGGAVYNNGTFNVSGTAYVAPGSPKNNDVFLYTDRYVTVAAEYAATASQTSTAPMTLSILSYYRGRQILSVASGVTIDDTLKGRFSLSEDNEGWDKDTVSNTVVINSKIYVVGTEDSGSTKPDGFNFGSSSGTGTKTNPYSSIAAAFDAVAGSNSEIIIAGTVKGTQTISGSKTGTTGTPVTLKGYKVTESSTPNGTLDGNQAGTTLTVDCNAASYTLTIKDLTITGGKADGTDGG